MATNISNQAFLSYSFGDSTVETRSNKATTVLEGPLTVTKTSMETSYRYGDTLTYIITLKNTGTLPISDVSVVDDLATIVKTTTLSVTPLDYVSPAHLYINGLFNSKINGTVEQDKVTFSISIPAGGVATIIYKARVNEYASIAVNSKLINTVKVSREGINVPVTAEHTLAVDNYALVLVEKTMEPNPVFDGGQIRYNFDIRNYGNQKATEIILSDIFMSPHIPSNLSVTIDGETFEEFSYESGELIMPKTTSAEVIEIDPATVNEDETTGIISIVPKTRKVVVTGTI